MGTVTTISSSPTSITKATRSTGTSASRCSKIARSKAGVFKLGFTGFGARFVDYENDGWLDLVVVNGAVRRSRQQAQHGDPFPLRQRNQLFRNDRGRRFVDVTASAGPAFAGLSVGRGLASGDLDNDGDTDLVVFNNSGPARVLLNDGRAAAALARCARC